MKIIENTLGCGKPRKASEVSLRTFEVLESIVGGEKVLKKLLI